MKIDHSDTTARQNVDHPSHYHAQSGVEVIDVAHTFTVDDALSGAGALANGTHKGTDVAPAGCPAV